MSKTKNYKLTLKNSLKMVTSASNHASLNNPNKYKSNDIYLMQVCGNSKKSKPLNSIDFKIACLNSEQTIGIYNEELNEQATIFDAHSETIINEIDFFKIDHNLLLTCGDDSHVKCWDLRNPRKDVLKYDGGGDSVKFLSCDIDCADSVIAASTSNNDANNSFVYLFDIKMSNKVLQKYEGAHSNDITQVKFDSMNKNRLVSASIDGLACVFDLLNLKTKPPKKASDDSDESSFDEDDDLIDQVYNTSSSVQKIGFLNSNNQYLYAITFTNDLFIWDMNTQDEVLKFSLFNSENPSDYIVDCFNSPQSPNQIILCLGDRNGNIQLYDDKKELIFNSNSIRTGDSIRSKHHSDLIRSSFWNYYQEQLFSIGEDGILNKWKFDFVAHDDEVSRNTACCSKRSNNDDDEDEDEQKEENRRKKRKNISNNKNRNKN